MYVDFIAISHEICTWICCALFLFVVLVMPYLGQIRVNLTTFFGYPSLALRQSMMTSSNGNIFRITGHLCGEFTGPGEFPAQRPVTRSFGVFFDLRKRLSKPSWGWWFETLSRPLWRHCNDISYDSPSAVDVTLKDNWKMTSKLAITKLQQHTTNANRVHNSWDIYVLVHCPRYSDVTWASWRLKPPAVRRVY